MSILSWTLHSCPFNKYRFILKTVKQTLRVFSILPHWWKADNSFKTLTANWPTDANETWWQNGDDDDDNVDDVHNEEEEEEEDDDDDDDDDDDEGTTGNDD